MKLFSLNFQQTLICYRLQRILPTIFQYYAKNNGFQFHLTSVTLHLSMILDFRYKGLRLLWEEGKTNKLPAGQVSRIEKILNAIHLARKVPQDFEFLNTGEFIH